MAIPSNSGSKSAPTTPETHQRVLRIFTASPTSPFSAPPSPNLRSPNLRSSHCVDSATMEKWKQIHNEIKNLPLGQDHLEDVRHLLKEKITDPEKKGKVEIYARVLHGSPRSEWGELRRRDGLWSDLTLDTQNKA
jgi:hypothetical protein